MANGDRKREKHIEDHDIAIFWFFLIDLRKVSLLRSISAAKKQVFNYP